LQTDAGVPGEAIAITATLYYILKVLAECPSSPANIITLPQNAMASKFFSGLPG